MFEQPFIEPSSEDDQSREKVRDAALEMAAREANQPLEKTAKAVLGKRILEGVDDSAVEADRTVLNAIRKDRKKGSTSETMPSTAGIEVTEEHETLQ